MSDIWIDWANETYNDWNILLYYSEKRIRWLKRAMGIIMPGLFVCVWEVFCENFANPLWRVKMRCEIYYANGIFWHHFSSFLYYYFLKIMLKLKRKIIYWRGMTFNDFQWRTLAYTFTGCLLRNNLYQFSLLKTIANFANICKNLLFHNKNVGELLHLCFCRKIYVCLYIIAEW